MSDEVWTEDWVPGNSYESKRNPETARVINKLLRYCLGVNYRLCCHANQAYHIIVIKIIYNNIHTKYYYYYYYYYCYY